jgi:hypothetical protein
MVCSAAPAAMRLSAIPIKQEQGTVLCILFLVEKELTAREGTYIIRICDQLQLCKASIKRSKSKTSGLNIVDLNSCGPSA